jgi:hypothetical protein
VKLAKKEAKPAAKEPKPEKKTAAKKDEKAPAKVRIHLSRNQS